MFPIQSVFVESCSLRLERYEGDKFHPRLNMSRIPIANKYREGKMKRTLERELKVPEIAKREAVGIAALTNPHCSTVRFLVMGVEGQYRAHQFSLEFTIGKTVSI